MLSWKQQNSNGKVRINKGAKRTLEVVNQLTAGLGTAAVSQIIEVTGFCRRTVFYHLRKLQEAGELRVAQRRCDDGELIPNLYWTMLYTKDERHSTVRATVSAFTTKEVTDREKKAQQIRAHRNRLKNNPIKTANQRRVEAEQEAQEMLSGAFMTEGQSKYGARFATIYKEALELVRYWKHLLHSDEQFGKWRHSDIKLKTAIKVIVGLEKFVDPLDNGRIDPRAYITAQFMSRRKAFDTGLTQDTVPMPFVNVLLSDRCMEVYTQWAVDANRAVVGTVQVIEQTPIKAFDDYTKTYVVAPNAPGLYDSQRRTSASVGGAALNTCMDEVGHLPHSAVCQKCSIVAQCEQKTYINMPWQLFFARGDLSGSQAARLRRIHKHNNAAAVTESQRLWDLGIRHGIQFCMTSKMFEKALEE